MFETTTLTSRLTRRPRRLRTSETIRDLVRETTLTPQKLVLPLFIIEGHERNEPIEAMPGRARLSVDLAVDECRRAVDLGVRAFALFGVIDASLKTPVADEALNPDNLLCRATRAIKEAIAESCVITDVALDPYSSLGHDGLVDERGVVMNDETVDMLAPMAVIHAEAGADIVAPSDMMDGRVGAIRAALDEADHTQTLILSYTAKYASAFYGPFRQALDSAPVDAPNVPKDKRTYQMDPANARTPRSTARRHSSTARSTDKRARPGIASIGSFRFWPSMMNNGRTSFCGANVVSRTRSRMVSLVRSRLGRRVSRDVRVVVSNIVQSPWSASSCSS